METIFGADVDKDQKISMKEFVEFFGGDMNLIEGKGLRVSVNSGAHGASHEKAQTATAAPRIGTASKWKNKFEELGGGRGSTTDEQPHDGADGAGQTATLEQDTTGQPASESSAAPATTGEVKEDAPASAATPAVAVAAAPPAKKVDAHNPPYLFRGINRKEADSILKRAKAADGDFLVRVKNEERLEYVLAVVFQGNPTHHAIGQGPDGALMINKQPCGGARSLHAVITYLSDSPPSWPVPLKQGIDRDSVDVTAPAPAADGGDTDTLGHNPTPKATQSTSKVGPDGTLSIRSKAKTFLTGEAARAASDESTEEQLARENALDEAAEELKKQQRAARRAHAEALHQKKLEQARSHITSNK